MINVTKMAWQEETSKNIVASEADVTAVGF